ncbi:hypothetical protein I7I51_06992 [Histoplasma capsulatum]|uniref:Uncharacterized protein n=1 Tax=Ajellomyces capsulatus TaxID=5037 RepID=A0A8A1MJR4_AJECA|nr:predicted protein [Histoplasma mississippiense (nom. inval.)]EDN10171.1 predicted protein [Histoplasma mississippiense (nom. inval.)]QSS66139.1 hypothetical protein I7I51_06992 [Histoplasma capsulatum]
MSDHLSLLSDMGFRPLLGGRTYRYSIKPPSAGYEAVHYLVSARLRTRLCFKHIGRSNRRGLILFFGESGHSLQYPKCHDGGKFYAIRREYENNVLLAFQTNQPLIFPYILISTLTHTHTTYI